ncbi:MAG: hypothetical protein RL142_79 [Actinomycetota bacterium]|jgi:hypothetical protein
MKLNLSRPVWWSATAVGVLGYLTLWPREYRIPCLFHAATGLLCPGCGTTRSLTALLHGDVATALAFNPLIYFIPVFLIAYELTKRSKYRTELNLTLAIVASVSTLGFFLVRNNFI